MPLAEIEKNFMRSLIEPYRAADVLLSQLEIVGDLSPEKQLAIYRGNINGAHEIVLAQVYPACKNILGEEYFNQLCLLYRIQFPSVNPDLNVYGQHFHEFIKSCIDKHKELWDFNYLPDLVLLEWYWNATYFDEDDSSFDFSRLTEVSAEQQHAMVFCLRKSVSLISSIYPIIDIWKSNRAEVSCIQSFNMPEKKLNYCIYRDDFEVKLKALSQIEFDLLTAINEKKTLGDLSEEFGTNLQSVLYQFVQQGWICGIGLHGVSDVR